MPPLPSAADPCDLPTGLAALRAVQRLEETASTNTLALRWSLELADDDLPALVTAERQTAGRGRGHNRWWSSDGALLGSLIVAPGRFGVPTAVWPALSLSVGAAIATAVEALAPRGDVRLKWPNDVFADRRKLAGVLIEIPPKRPDRMVIGFGVNVNNALAEAPADIRRRAVALCELTAGPLDREAVLDQFLRQLWSDFAALGRSDPALRDRWRRLCLLTGRSVVIESHGRRSAGTCLGIDDDGALRLQTDRCQERHFSGTVVDYE